MFANLRKRGECLWLRPDAKYQLPVADEDGKPVRLDSVVISRQTTEEGADKEHYSRIERIAKNYLDRTGLMDERTKFYINPTGKFVIGGSGDCGADLLVETPDDLAVIQCKFYTHPAGYEAVKEAYTVKPLYKATAAYVITNTAFTPRTRQTARQLGVTLTNHGEIAALLDC